MGDIIRVTCSGCDLDRRAFVGVGMLAQGQELCACHRCRSLEIIPTDADSPLDDDVLKCSVCRTSVSPVQDEDVCPLCQGTLSTWLDGNWD